MRLEIFKKTIHERKRSLIGWSIGILSVVAMYVALWPTIEGQAADFQKLIDTYPDALKSIFGLQDITSASGYLNTELFSFMAPLMFLIFAIAMATDLTAGEEERKTIDLLMAAPVTRTRVIAEKFAGLAVSLVLLAGVLALSLIAGARIAGMDVGTGNIMAAALDQMLLGLAFGAIALVLACVTGKRGLSRGISSAVAVGAFLISSLAPLAEWLEPYRWVSPMYHAIGTEPLTRGFAAGNAAILVLLGLVFLGGSVVAFNRRDLAI